MTAWSTLWNRSRSCVLIESIKTHPDLEAAAVLAHHVADRAVVGGELDAGRQVGGRPVLPERDCVGDRGGGVGVVEVASVVAAQHPQAGRLVPGRVDAQEAPHVRGKRLDLLLG